MIQQSPSGRLQVAQQTPLGDFPCLGCQQITPGSLSGIPTENGGSPFGSLWVFFPPITPQIPTGYRAEAGRRPAGVPRAYELIWWTSVDHPPNFNCELKCSGCHPTSKGWALQECLFVRRPPDLSMGTKWGAKLAAWWLCGRFFSIVTLA